MPLQPLLPILMHSMPLPNLTQTIPHQKLIIPRREQRRRHIDQNRYPAVIHIAKSFTAKEDSRHDSRSEVTSEVCGDGDVREAPDHGSVCETDSEGSASGRDEGVRGVQASPDDDANVGVNEEFGQEEVAEISGGGTVLGKVFSAQRTGRERSNEIEAHVRLIGIWERAQNACGPAIEYQWLPSS